MTTTVRALGPVVDVLVAQPVRDLCVAELQAQIGAVSLQVDRLTGWLSTACGELQARTGGVVRTKDGGSRTVASWLAEQTRETPSLAGSVLRTSGLLLGLPVIAAAVLDGVITQRKAAVLTRLVGKIADEHLQAVQAQLVQVAVSKNPDELAAWVRHEIATHCEPVLDGEADSARRRRFLRPAGRPTAACGAVSCSRLRTPRSS